MSVGAGGLARAGVIAAGRGDRLRLVPHTLKPLVRVGGQTLIERVLLSLAEAKPTEVAVIVNEASLAVKEHVTLSRPWPFVVRWIVETTPSSMHSFLRVIEALAEDGAGGPFLISTVDAIAPPGAFAAFEAASAGHEADLTLAVAPPTEDEKPLLLSFDDGGRVTAIGANVPHRAWATAGYYAVSPSVLREAEEARRDGVTALRLFFERLFARGYHMRAVPVSGGIDVDRPADIRAAETFLKQVGA